MREDVEARVLVFKGCLVGLLYGFCFVDHKFVSTKLHPTFINYNMNLIDRSRKFKGIFCDRSVY
jgi:hypothetical protein